ncbi:hypothetical protein PPL_06675 [Heterostelium album PN500]|uniref:Uncharacterized protein n=1 Tax=Heterostelium pallidum (strain ATCC 26659 / Pp 5 / PN500) TaxID=670386 RepID=D3BFE2_HETP5|nr:hypothetical protein PPL_06675 [Heterostelium album PN500]EFA79856.1 hypothetical protein PPL_06675 [Heterostelium album PN500]|eukprot:XP_020431977.1 hypothetical protein PPL_06675 [Heterostelium album PN500]
MFQQHRLNVAPTSTQATTGLNTVVTTEYSTNKISISSTTSEAAEAVPLSQALTHKRKETADQPKSNHNNNNNNNNNNNLSSCEVFKGCDACSDSEKHESYCLSTGSRKVLKCKITDSDQTQFVYHSCTSNSKFTSTVLFFEVGVLTILLVSLYFVRERKRFLLQQNNERLAKQLNKV